MFFNKKKKDVIVPLTVNNPVFGKVRNFGNWFTVEPIQFSLWNKSFTVKLRMVANGEQDQITNQQEESGLLFQENTVKFKSQIEQNIQELFDDLSIDELEASIIIQGFYFAKDGRIGVALSADLDNDYLEEHEIGPDNNFGFSIYPKYALLPSNEEFLDFFE